MHTSKMKGCGALLALAVGCGGEGESDFTCSAAERSGTYLMTYTERSGDCGPIPEQLGRLDDAEAVAEGCMLDAPDRWTEGECKLERAYTCAEDGVAPGAYGSAVAVTEQIDDSGDRITGTLSFRLYGADGVQLCGGTYDLTASRQ